MGDCWMKQFWLLCLPFFVCLLSAPCSITAQDAWRVIPMESPSDHHPLPLLKAIGIPATATYRGKEYKAFVFIFGHAKGPGVFGPSIEIYIEGLRNLVPEEELDLFEGPEATDADAEVRAMTVSVKRGKQVFRVSSALDLHMGNYPLSIVQNDGSNNVFGASSPSRGPRLTAWTQFMHEMSFGFEEGQISFGGKAPSSKIEIGFSGNGIELLLKDLIRFVGP
jgi:hypothetical protein